MADKCLICGSGESVFVKQSGPSGIVLCKECGLAYRNPDMHDEAMLLRVPDEKKDIKQYAEGFHRGHTIFNKFVADKVASVRRPPGRLLDVGCGFGDMLGAARDAGWDAYGLDVSEDGVAVCCEKGFKAYTCTTANLPADAPRDYDAVTIKGVLSYLTDPSDELVRIHGMLKPGGALVIRDLNCDFHVYIYSFYSRFKKLFTRFGLGDPSTFHRYSFSPRAMRKLASMAGFEVVEVSPSPMVRGDPYSYAKKSMMKRLLSLFALASDVGGLAVWRLTGGRVVITPSFIAVCRKPGE